jgi:hypothetical protein
MKKILICTGVVLGVLVLAAYIFLQFFLGSMVKSGVSQHGTRLTQTTVELRTANLSPLSGRGTLWGFSVANPKGWSGHDAFSIGTIHVELAPFSIFDGHVLVHEILIDSPQINYEAGVLSSNVGDLLKNIKESAESAKKAPSEHPIKLEVQHVEVRNAKVTVGFGPAATTLPMPTVELNDIGVKEGGVSPGQLALAIMHSITPSVIAVATHTVVHIVPTLGNAAETTVKKTGEAIKEIFEDKDKDKDKDKK